MPLTLIDEVFYWTVSCLLTKRTWEIDQHMLKNNPEGKYLFGEVCFLSFFAPIALHGTLYGENGPKKSHLERSEQKSSENRPPQKWQFFGLFFAIFSLGPKQMIEKSHFLEFNLEEPCRKLNCQVQFCSLKTDSHCLWWSLYRNYICWQLCSKSEKVSASLLNIM